MLCTAHGCAFTREGFGRNAVERHGRGGHVVARAEGNGKYFCAGEEVHGVGAGKVEGVVSLHERGSQHVVVERVGVGGRSQFGFAHGILLCGIEHGVGVGRGGGLLGNGGVGHGDGLRHVVHGDDDELAVLCRCAHCALLQAAFAGHGLAVGVSRAVNGHGRAGRSHDGVGVGLQIGFGKLPAAAAVFRTVIFPKAERYGAVQGVVASYAHVPVEVLRGCARGVVGSDVVVVARVVSTLEVSAGGLAVGQRDEAGLVGVA